MQLGNGEEVIDVQDGVRKKLKKFLIQSESERNEKRERITEEEEEGNIKVGRRCRKNEGSKRCYQVYRYRS